MSAQLYALGRWCFQHAKLVLAAWLIAVLAMGGAALAFRGSFADVFKIPGSSSQVALDKLRMTFPQGAMTQAAAIFVAPEGGRVVECKLAGPAETTYNPPGTDLPQGSIVCPVTTDDPAKPWLQPRVDQYGTESYVSWLVLRADETGAYTVIDIGRAFE